MNGQFSRNLDEQVVNNGQSYTWLYLEKPRQK
jgi:hypothetical protein